VGWCSLVLLILVLLGWMDGWMAEEAVFFFGSTWIRSAAEQLDTLFYFS
jgi:hypothetical protein